MAHRLAAPNRFVGPSLWLLALATIVLASGALLVILWSPRALALALALGILALAARSVHSGIRSSARRKSEASSAVANTGLVLASFAVAPLIAFALLWTSLLLLLGVTWVLHALNLI